MNEIKGVVNDTLEYLIIVQDVINVQAGKFPEINKRPGCNKAVQVGIFQKSIVKKTMQAGKFSEINKRAGCNKAMQVGIFQKSIVKKSSLLENFQKLINMQDVIRPCRLENFKKLIRTCCTFIR